MPLEITKNDKARRFEAVVNGETAFLRFHMAGETMHLLYVEVPIAARGHGVAAEMTKYVLDYAQRHGFNVVPVCSYIRAYLLSHPKYEPLLAK
jgi:predicted GNAT family acetyltransferase